MHTDRHTMSRVIFPSSTLPCSDFNFFKRSCKRSIKNIRNLTLVEGVNCWQIYQTKTFEPSPWMAWETDIRLITDDIVLLIFNKLFNKSSDQKKVLIGKYWNFANQTQYKEKKHTMCHQLVLWPRMITKRTIPVYDNWNIFIFTRRIIIALH